MAVERLQKILSNAGVASRRVAEELILAGRVAVNDEVRQTLGARADLETDVVTVDGVPVVRGQFRYFVLNKPRGFIATAADERGRDTVLDLVPIGDVQLHTVGRLDRESEGLLIVTNDGRLTALLTHPRNEVEKEYLVGIDAPISKRDLQRLVRGIESDGERLRADSAMPALAPPLTPGDEEPEAPGWVVITLHEGRNREIRRMMGALGREVIVLRRTRVGPLTLGNLGPGAFRELDDEEVRRLYATAKQAESLAEARDATPAGATPPATPRSSRASSGRPPPRRSRRAAARRSSTRSRRRGSGARRQARRAGE